MKRNFCHIGGLIAEGGTTFVVTLPRDRKPASAGPSQRVDVGRQRG